MWIMADYRLTDADTSLIFNDPRLYANLPVDLSWCPVVKIQDTITIKDYTMTAIEGPAASALGTHAMGVSSSKTETERDVMSLRYKFEFNKSEMAIAQAKGYAMVQSNLRVGMEHMNKVIARVLFQGALAHERMNISGMLDVGEDTAGVADAWDTATKPVAYFMELFNDMVANSYAGPYTLILSWNLLAGMKSLNAAGGQSHEAIIRPFLEGPNGEAGKIVYADNGAYALTNPLPLPAATVTDGVAILCAPNSENMHMAQITNGVEISPLEFDRDTNTFSTFIEWRGTPVFRGATTASAGSAPYIVFEPDVNLA